MQQRYNYAFFDEASKREIRRALIKGVSIPGYQVPFASREMPIGRGWGTGGLQLGVVVMDGGTVNDQLRIAHVSGIVADKHPHAQRTFGFGVLGLLYVRTGDRIALAVQDLDQGIGSGTAAADKMHMLHTIKQMGIIAVDKRHKFHLKKIRRSRSCQPGNQFVWRMAL